MNLIGDTIRNTRKKQKLTLKEVSTMASISLSFLSEIERDKVNPSLSVLKRIANALGVNFTDLFGEEKRSIVIRKNERKPLVHSEGSRICSQSRKRQQDGTDLGSSRKRRNIGGRQRWPSRRGGVPFYPYRTIGVRPWK
ncbi:helix-turn-helix domain-containing protein [Paenibacillus sp. XY044]|uniref:helix-turn-helix domain-containing protein n=1 Tax=Paenibacillus sp. XY044 TaxID=2026089 RepID=UPI00211AE161|nr:helix-turn-helix transcriptional regulator [Paenibacillus sp. XY044]